MPEMLDDIAYLSQEVGPRPAGTEEEQQAALYIADQFQNRAGLSAEIEDFSCVVDPEIVRLLCFGLAAAFSIGAVVTRALVLPAFIVSAVCAVLYVLEIMGKPVLSRAFERGASQNVVARLKPTGEASRARRRKLIIVANYDSGRVQAELKDPILRALPILQIACVAALVATPIVWMLRGLFFMGVTAGGLIFWNVVSIAAIVLMALPVALYVLHRMAPYSEAANSNASGVATLIEVASRIASAQGTEGDAAEYETTIHGEDAARAAGLVPEGAQLEYDMGGAGFEDDDEGMTPEERLAAAKANIAALTGKPVREYAPRPTSVADNLVQARDAELDAPTHEEVAQVREEVREALGQGYAQAAQQAASVGTAAAVASSAAAGSSNDVPDWFKTARAKANKTSSRAGKPAARSRYADALDAAVSTSSGFFQQANQAVAAGTTIPSSIGMAQEREAQPAQAAAPAVEAAAADSNADPARPAHAMPHEGNQDAATDEDPGHTRPIEPVVAPEATTAMPSIDVAALHGRADADAEAETMEPPSVGDDPANRPSVRVRPARHAQERVIIEDDKDEPIQPAQDMRAQDVSIEPEPEAVERPRIVLPDVDESEYEPIAAAGKQRAPLAEAAAAMDDEEGGSPAASRPDRSMLSGRIPRISAGQAAAADGGISDNKRAALGALLPTMSGTITEEPIKKESEQENQVVGLTGSFAAVGATGAFKPVGDELVRGVAPEDLYIDDADDSGFEENVTQTGAYAGPGYMDMPKERKHRFFNFFHRKKRDQEEEVSASAWLGVDESFDARQVGKARGSWESFQEGSDFEPSPAADPVDGGLDAGDAAYDYDDDYDYIDADDDFAGDYDEYGYGDDDRSWKGGAFSRVRDAVAARGVSRGAAPEGDPDADAASENTEERETRDGQRARRRPRPQRDQEARQVAEFHGSGRIDMEVWFVALGSEGSGNGGMRAFMREHADELRGSIIVNIDSVGAGDLSIVSQEGAYVHKNIASRMKRYAAKASRACGVAHGTAAMPWRESAAALAMKNRIMAMTVAGVEGGKPALLAQADDVIDAVDEGKLEDAAAFVMALAQAI